jgi:alpha-L-arabinofuranosidase
VKKLGDNAVLTVLKAGNLEDVNSFARPGNVQPVEQKLSLRGNKIPVSMAPYSFNVIRVRMQ